MNETRPPELIFLEPLEMDKWCCERHKIEPIRTESDEEKAIINALTELERQVFRLRQQKITIMDVAEMLKINRSHVFRVINSVKGKLEFMLRIKKNLDTESLFMVEDYNN
jgi:DNA-directed RNA polymerase specialized sigma subunit